MIEGESLIDATTKSLLSQEKSVFRMAPESMTLELEVRLCTFTLVCLLPAIFYPNSFERKWVRENTYSN